MSASTVPIITCRGVTKLFQTGEHTVSALLDVDLEVLPGEFVVLLRDSRNNPVEKSEGLAGAAQSGA